ncbi:hypothetical protein EV207_12838 [Scopulibacillus darangshiensis]|uniref:Uncharacterized protein n=1 Tax=Scopulibacillus darangshiensis TaxID=442528 RepID=A0A4R2NR55_9BACL|nr:hypothetical protein [Scopulibacillus darangshiensis]TCP23815.1 hypothetical protein EV207_12838 [Scopulibacillus darangshiensis]
MDCTLKEFKSQESALEIDASVIDSVKSSLQSQTIIFNTFQKSVDGSRCESQHFDQFLIDDNGNYWFTEKVTDGQSANHLYIYNHSGKFLRSLAVNGKATLYEYAEWMIAACEGPDNKGYIYKYSKDTQQLVEQWVMNGFLWDIEMDLERLYITSYLPMTDEAVLYQIKGKTIVKQVLGTGFFPTGIIGKDKCLYVSTSQIFSSGKGEMMRLDLDGNILDQFDIEVSPRQIFEYEGQLVLHGLDLAEGKAETLVYVDPDLGICETYSIPRASQIRTQGQYLLLFNEKAQSLMYWSHRKKRVIRVVHWPMKKQEYKIKDLSVNH